MSRKAAGVQIICEALTRQNEEDEEPRVCGVCGDLANGYHFNVLTCEGCKGFFRRTIKRSAQLQCPLLNKCVITKNNRRSCQACRFRKCQAVGMRKDSQPLKVFASLRVQMNSQLAAAIPEEALRWWCPDPAAESPLGDSPGTCWTFLVVMSDEEVLERRVQIKKKKILDTPTQLSSQQEKMIQELLCGHRSAFDLAFSRFCGFRPMDRNILPMNEYKQSASKVFHPLTECPTNCCTTAVKFAADPTSSSSSTSCSSSSSRFHGSIRKQENHKENKVENSCVFTALPHVADLTTYMIQEIIRFSKTLQDFRSLSMGDQISLLKGATFEIMQIRFNMVFNSKTSTWECGNITYCIDDAVRAGFQPLLLEPLFKFHHTLRTLDLQEEEYVLIQALSLFSPDRPGVQEHSVIDKVHENLALTLKTWIDCKRTGPQKHLLYPKVIACFTEMRTMTEEYSKQILQIWDIQPDTISPLIMEVVSKSSCNDV